MFIAYYIYGKYHYHHFIAHTYTANVNLEPLFQGRQREFIERTINLKKETEQFIRCLKEKLY